MILEKEGNTEAAINKYSDAISIKPKLWEAYSYRAKAYFSIANYDNAIADISQAITLSPKDNSLYEIRANCYLEKESYDKALADYNVALSNVNKKDANYFLTFFKRGKALYYNKRYEDAIGDYTQSILLGKADPKNAENISYTTAIYLWRGQSYMEAKRYPEAIKDFDTHLAAFPNYLQSLFYQGFCYFKNGETEKAKANALKIIDIDPSKEIYFTGEHLLDIYDLEARRKTVKLSLDDAKASFEGYKSASSKTLGNIKLSEAFAKTNKAWLYSSGISKEDRDLKDTIQNLFYKVYPLMTEKPELPELARKYMVQANTAAENKKYNEAVLLWNKAISIAPYYPLSYFNRALVKEILNDYKGATADTKTYIQLYPDAPNVRAAQDKIYEWEPKLKTNSTTITTTSVPGAIMQNKPASTASKSKVKFIMRGGLNIPKGGFEIVPTNFQDSEFLKKGNMGAKPGYFVEAGLGLGLNEASKVQFYYNPLIISYASNKMDWGGGSSAPDSKDIRIIEVAQRYGIGFQPVRKMQIAVYYRPAGVIPLDFKASAPSYEVAGTMSQKMVFMMSHTFGVTVSYSFIALSFESYYAQPTFDVTIKNNEAAPPTVTNVDAIKIPFRTNRIGIAFTL
jgi:tetratricopeptide (TPR) repeat protein